MRVKNVFKILKEIKYLRSVLKQYSDRMVKGEYLLLKNFRTISLKNENALDFSKLYFKKPNESARMGQIAQKFNSLKTFVNKNKKTTEEYDIIYTSNNNNKIREVKLFSSKQKKMLVICVSEEEKQKQIKQYERFHSAYNMPLVKDIGYYENAFEISLISIKEFPEERKALKSICDSTVLATSSPEKCKKVSAEEITDFSYSAEENELLEGIRSKISKDALLEELPFSVQHGDISKENLLYGEADGKTDFWWIDWEHARERVFFYDLFFYMINSAYYYNDEALRLYLSGEMDEILKAFFNHFGVKFNSEKRKDYLLIYMMVFLKERVCAFGRVSALREYVEFLEKLWANGGVK